jgi:hypothetical protein
VAAYRSAVLSVLTSTILLLGACSSLPPTGTEAPSTDSGTASPAPSATNLYPGAKPITEPIKLNGFVIGLDPHVGWYPIGAGAIVLTDLYHPHAEASMQYPPVTIVNSSMAATLNVGVAKFGGVQPTPVTTLRSQPTGPARAAITSLQKPHLLLSARSFTYTGGHWIMILAAEDRNGDGRPGDGPAIIMETGVRLEDTSGYQEYMAYLLARDLQLAPAK